MRLPEKLLIGLLSALLTFLALPGGSPLPQAEGASEKREPVARDKTTGLNVTRPSSTDLLAIMRPVLDRLRESVGVPAPPVNRSLSDSDLLNEVLREVRRPVACKARTDVTQARHFGFLLATVPDYVDSNTAWMADEILGAVQAAMPHAGYVLDRFYLPDIPRDAGADATPPADPSAARLHEAQPGAMIFRGECGWQVVLIALETATSGLHVTAFENAARFITLWQRRTHSPRELRIVGPTFSGSVPFMVASLERLGQSEPRLGGIHVLSGSATADGNAAMFESLCLVFKGDCSYTSAMHSNASTVDGLCTFLGRVNPSWLPRRVGVLQEFNTSFGITYQMPEWCVSRQYTFPLHIAQLRGNTRAAPELPLLLTPPAIALKLGERTRPIDLVPAMRPDLASPITDMSITAVLDDIRHSGLAAVGIYATDVRDALFLSREIKRAAPDVQLFFPNAHRLYLHRDFVAFTRGAIVASTYPLAAMPQMWGTGSRSEAASLQEVFPSTVAQGVFIATKTQVDEVGGYLPDYPYSDGDDADRIGTPRLGPKPGLWLSMIGDDGFWPLHQTPSPSGSGTAGPLLERWPRSMLLAAFALALIIAAHAGVFFLKWDAGRHRRSGDDPSWLDRLQGWSVLRALAPPAAFVEFGRLHERVSVIAHIHVACLGLWMASVILVNQFGNELTLAPVIWLIPLAASASVALSPAPVFSPWSTLPQVETRTVVRPIRSAEALIGACLLLPGVTLLWFVISTYWRLPEATAMLAAARTIGGGIASPAASTLLLAAATYVPVIWSLRRLSALGYGYATLERSSKAFRRLLGSEEVASLTSLLDMPARHLPRGYLGAIATAMIVIAALLLPNVASVDGLSHTLFLGASSLVGLGAALALMVQSLEIWRRLRVLLLAMTELPLGAALTRLGMPRLTWNISIVPPDTRDLRVPVHLVAELRDRIEDPRVAGLLGADTKAALDDVLQEDGLERRRGAIPLTQSTTWLKLWELCDTLLPQLESCRWARGVDRTNQSLVCDARPSPVAHCLDCCETLLATSRALVLRDVTARIMSGVFAAMLILGLLAAAHLLYLFQGRASFLTLDVIVLGLASAAAVWTLLGMEKDAILSLIWRTTPGRVNFNWALIQRLVVYGALPLLIVLGSMFPEVGEKLVHLIDPLRRLTAM